MAPPTTWLISALRHSARALPFDHDHVPTLLALIKRGQYEMDSSITGDARDLVQRMLVKDVVMRISVSGPNFNLREYSSSDSVCSSEKSSVIPTSRSVTES